MNIASKTDSNDNLDLIVDQFEDSWNRRGGADIREFLPPSESPQYAEILCELIRLDLEIRCAKMNSPTSKSIWNDLLIPN